MQSDSSQLKMLSREAIPTALEKAERYRLLNEPAEAESICRDILRIDPQNQQALVVLLLALTDEYENANGVNEREIQELLPQLQSAYQRAYYAGINAERKAKAKLRSSVPGAGTVAYMLLQQAMQSYEEAERVRPTGNDDALLRWNTCVRIIERFKLSATPQEWQDPPLE